MAGILILVIVIILTLGAAYFIIKRKKQNGNGNDDNPSYDCAAGTTDYVYVNPASNSAGVHVIEYYDQKSLIIGTAGCIGQFFAIELIADYLISEGVINTIQRQCMINQAQALGWT